MASSRIAFIFSRVGSINISFSSQW
jgi:hypothetical protein